jgi:aspartyl-tRNA synthetase
MGKINNESIVDIYGTVKKLSKPIESCSIKNVEIGITHCYVVSSSKNVLPFQIEDAMNDENKPEEGKITVALATKLDNRVLDLRLPSNQAIFRIKAAICRFYRGYLDS